MTMMRARRKWTPRRFSLNFIEESDLGKYLHFALQVLHIEPGVFMGFRTRNEPVTDGERSFMMASIYKAITDGETPIQIKHFSKKQETGGSS